MTTSGLIPGRYTAELLVGFARETRVENSWFNTKDFSIYVRVGRRVIPEVSTVSFVKCFDLSNITCNDPGKGKFTRLLSTLEGAITSSSNTCQCVGSGEQIQFLYVENVLTDKFAEFFRNRGYSESFNNGPFNARFGVSSFYRPTRVIDKNWVEALTHRA